jgi:hypothetical protein
MEGRLIKPSGAFIDFTIGVIWKMWPGTGSYLRVSEPRLIFQ